MNVQSKHFVAAVLFWFAASFCAAQSTTGVGKVVDGVGRAATPDFYRRWMFDQDYLANLAKDPNPRMQAAKKTVVQFEADLARLVAEGRLNEKIDAVLERYLVADYVQHDPNIPQGRKGLAEWFKAGGMHEGSEISLPPAPIALTADPGNGWVTMILETEPQPAPNDAAKKYPGYMISVFRVKDGRLTEHYSQSMRGAYYCRIDCGPSAQNANVSGEQLAARLQALEGKYQKLQDENEIEKLQRIYGYYIERGQLDEVADLFSTSPEVTLEMSGRSQKGTETIKRMFSSATPFGVMKPGTKPEDYLHVTAPITGVVDVNPDGRTAQGRWYGLMFLNNAGMGGGAVWGVGIYENDYIKEDGKWKILRLRFDDLFLSTYDKKGWINTMPSFTDKSGNMPPPGRGRSAKTPFADPMPYHYKHPITGE